MCLFPLEPNSVSPSLPLFIPPDFVNTPRRLQTLNLSSNKFVRFPGELSAMLALRELNLSNNLVALLPRSISDLTQLNILNLNRQVADSVIM